ncbi:unnamed protein product [Litomosoides sigmodontis]|uniref:RNA helicase n=1 Tax=Litomosoides sigmodontis TaxID=42156 RepID=A0A3P6SWA7_LITSI|nr:unnamed protein product [Litomosoides sigmodontis]
MFANMNVWEETTGVTDDRMDIFATSRCLHISRLFICLVRRKNLTMNMGKVVQTADIETNVTDFNSLMLNRTSLNALAKAGFSRPSPVQVQAIPSGMLGLDLLVQAKSGTGKTMVFSLLAVENLNAQFGRPQVLIVAPTREIASQIVSYIRMLAPAVIHVGMFVGGNEKGVAEDIQKLRKSIHIVVGTAGRLCHLVRINALRLSYIRLFVLDEADKLMEDSFQKEINYLFSTLPPEKQVAVFSATYPYQLDATLTRYMRDVHFVRVDRDPQLLGVKQYVVVAQNSNKKMDILLRLLILLRYGQCIIFVNDHKKCDELHAGLQQAGFNAVCISGNMSQSVRTKVMRQLKNCMVKLLVSTDLTARGIDAPGVNIVVNYGSPFVLATYLHRIGRAGRFGTQGAAFTIIGNDKESKLFSDLVVEGKLRTKLLRAEENLPSNLIYDDEFFSRSEDFHLYTPRNWHSERTGNEVSDKNPYEYRQIDANNVKECEEQISNSSEGKITLHLKSAKRVYSNQDFYSICRNMKNSEIADTLLKKLVALKIRSPLNRKNTLMTFDIDRINESGQKMFAKPDLDMHISMSKCYVGCKKGRYLRNQILAIRNTLSDEEWLQYTRHRYGPATRYEPFLFHEGSSSDRPNEKCVMKSDLDESNPVPDENDAIYETSKELITKLAKIKSQFNYELAFRIGKIRECTTTTEIPAMCTVATQTEDEGKPIGPSNTQKGGLSFESNVRYWLHHAENFGRHGIFDIIYVLGILSFLESPFLKQEIDWRR